MFYRFIHMHMPLAYVYSVLNFRDKKYPEGYEDLPDTLVDEVECKSNESDSLRKCAKMCDRNYWKSFGNNVKSGSCQITHGTGQLSKTQFVCTKESTKFSDITM